MEKMNFTEIANIFSSYGNTANNVTKSGFKTHSISLDHETYFFENYLDETSSENMIYGGCLYKKEYLGTMLLCFLNNPDFYRKIGLSIDNSHNIKYKTGETEKFIREIDKYLQYKKDIGK